MKTPKPEKAANGIGDKAIRIYFPCPYKGAYVFVRGEVVTHASKELGFTIGWTETRLRERATAVGFRMSTLLRMVEPNPTWLSKNPKLEKAAK